MYGIWTMFKYLRHLQAETKVVTQKKTKYWRDGWKKAAARVFIKDCKCQRLVRVGTIVVKKMQVLAAIAGGHPSIQIFTSMCGKGGIRSCDEIHKCRELVFVCGGESCDPPKNLSVDGNGGRGP